VALLSQRTSDTVTTDESRPATDDDATVVVPDRVREQRPAVREEQAVVGRAQVDEREAARRRLATPPPSGTVVDTTRPEVVVAGPRPRASMLATLALVIGVVATLALLTGVLTGPAVAVGAIAALFGFGGISATTRRHVAGKTDALLGIALGLATVVVGTLTLTGTVALFDGGANYVTEARDWLQAQLPWLFPS
jgi:hypothetical protein